ncbi:hypothetical protein F4604DRAFT_1911247 [Suillus subluteus]|nr:hypothetical protein F4604DRAFT_1911247 [Suillus subluteus]
MPIVIVQVSIERSDDPEQNWAVEKVLSKFWFASGSKLDIRAFISDSVLFAWSCDNISKSLLCLSITMSFIHHEIIGSFADVPAVIRVNGASIDSTVSLSFLHSCNVPRSIFNHNGVAVESNSGLTFRSVYLKGCDVELGRDWLAFVNARLDGFRFLRPLETDLAQLSAGHTWNVQPGGVQSVHLFVCYPSGIMSGYPKRVHHLLPKLRRPGLSAFATAHGLSVPENSTIEELREIISHHQTELILNLDRKRDDYVVH